MRKLVSPSTRNGRSSFFRTPAVDTRHTVASSSRFLNGVNGTQYRESSSGFSISPQLVQRLHDLVGRRLLPDVVDVDVADDALLIDDENRALDGAAAAQDAVLRRHVPVRPVVAEE